MFYRPLLICAIALGLAACGGESYEKSSTGEYQELPQLEEPTLPNTGELINGNLEDSQTEATGWDGYANGTGSATFELSSEQYFTGTQSFKMSVDSVGENPWDIAGGITSQAVNEGYTYNFTAYVLGTNGAIANFQVQLTEDPWTTLGGQQIETSSEWRKVSISFTVPAGVDTVQIMSQLSYQENAGAVFYVDFARLVGSAPDAGGLVDIDLAIEDGLPGWSNNGKPTTLGFDADEGLVITPAWEAGNNDIAMYVLEAPIADATGITFNYVINLPQDWIDAGVNFQPYVQQSGGSYAGDWSGWTAGSSFTAGTNVLSYTPAAAPADIGRVGIQLLGDGLSYTPSGNMSISRVYYQVEAEASSDIPLDSGWALDTSAGGNPSYDENGVSYSPTAQDDKLIYDFTGPDNLEGATITLSISADQDFIDSGANLQPYAQEMQTWSVGEWSCSIDNSALSTTPTDFSCTLREDGSFNLDDGEGLRFGVMAKGTPAGSVTIHDVQIEYPNVSVADDAGWYSNTGDPSYDNGVSFSPTAEDDNLLINLSGPQNYVDAVFTFSIAADQDFIDSGANLQPYALKQETWEGQWDCGINNSALSTEPGNFSCTLTDAAFNLVDGDVMRLGIKAKGTPAGSVTISKVGIVYGN